MTFEEWLCLLPEGSVSKKTLTELAFAKEAFYAKERQASGDEDIMWLSPKQYEPVGATVKVKTKSGVYFAFRRSPTLNKDRSGVYYKKISGEEIKEEVLGWTYP